MASLVVILQLLNRVQLFVTPWTAAYQPFLSFTISQSLSKLISIESVTPSNHLILCHPLLLFSIFLSIRIFSNESALCIRWPKYQSFSFSISPSNEYSGLTFSRTGWFDLLSVQRRNSAFFMIEFLHSYVTMQKTIALIIWTFGGKVKSL